MQKFTLFISYISNRLTNEWYKEPPILIEALSEEEASRTAIAVADFAVLAVSPNVLIRVTSGQTAGSEDGRPIAEIRRPIEN